MPPDTPKQIAPLLSQVREKLHPAAPQLAAAITAVIPAVCSAHIQDVRNDVPLAATLTDDAVRDDLPQLLQALAKAYAQEDCLAQLAMLGPGHAAARVGQGFSIRDTFGEYVRLRHSLRAHVEDHLKRALTKPEYEALDAGMDAVLSETVISFHQQKEDRIQLETTALSHYLTSLAHDLRNEINGVMLSLQLIEETGQEIRQPGEAGSRLIAGPQLDDLLRDVSACRTTMESTITAMTRLLEAERLRNALVVRPRDVEMLTFLQGVARSASRPGSGSSPLGKINTLERIEIRCPPDFVLWTDPDLLGAVLVNLVGNAVKYAPDARVFVTATRTADHHCRLEVSDEGPGIPASRLEHLFDKFERGGRTDAAGLGLGLFIARRATHLLGGQIQVTSEVNAGTCFVIDLPPLALQPEEA